MQEINYIKEAHMQMADQRNKLQAVINKTRSAASSSVAYLDGLNENDMLNMLDGF